MARDDIEKAKAVGLDILTLEERAKALVQAAIKSGATAADAYVGIGSSQSVSVRDGNVEVADRSESDGFTLRVFVGDKHAQVSSNMPGEEQQLAERAIAMAKVSPSDPFTVLGDENKLAEDLPNLDLFDSTQLSSDELTDMARRAEAAALAVDGISNISSVGASSGTGGMVLATSHGFVGSSIGSNYSCGIAAIAGEGATMQRDWEFSSKKHFADLDAMEDVGRIAAERTIARLNPQKPKTGTYPILLDPRCSNSFVGHLSSAINGAAIARKTSFLKDHMGQQIMANGVTIVDDPHIVRGPASRPCDAEGVTNGALELVREGVLQQWLLDTGTAMELGLETNGRANRGGPGTTNIAMMNGKQSREELISAVGNGLYVTDFIGSGVNMVTGDYSRGVSGFWIENGELAYPVSEVTIAGNLKDIFLNLVPANDLEYRYGSNAPTLLIGDMTLAGK